MTPNNEVTATLLTCTTDKPHAAVSKEYAAPLGVCKANSEDKNNIPPILFLVTGNRMTPAYFNAKTNNLRIKMKENFTLVIQWIWKISLVTLEDFRRGPHLSLYHRTETKASNLTKYF